MGACASNDPIRKGLQELINMLNAVTKQYKIKISVKQTKVMCISEKSTSKVCLLIDDQQVEQVSQFKYLGSWISDDGYASKDIRARIAMVRHCS